MLEVHVKWFLNELLVSLIMPLLSSKSVDEKINQFFLKLAAFWRLCRKFLWKYNLNEIREVVTTCF